MLRTALVVLLLACLPGALIFRVPLFDRARRAALAAEERWFWTIVLSAALSSMVALSLAVAGSYAPGAGALAGTVRSASGSR